jgi:SAM-dependent methyltransferase
MLYTFKGELYTHTPRMNTVDLIAFYKTPLGSLLHADISALITKIWPDMMQSVDGNCVSMGFGYATPYLYPTAKHIAMAPGTMGGVSWPSHASKSILVNEGLLPLPDQCLDRILVVHGFEYMTNTQLFLAECYRVLNRNGRLLIITPNRRSLWAHQDCTPLGHGQPYTMTQLRRQLEHSSFSEVQHLRGLYTPPRNSDLCISCWRLYNAVGARLAPKFSGLVAIEAEKSAELKGTFVNALSALVRSKMAQHALNMGNRRVLIDPVP